LAEVEQMVLLAVLRLAEGAYALQVLEELDREAGHAVSRGSLYKTLERLGTKGLVVWDMEEGTPVRGGHPRRRFRVTDLGIEALGESRQRLLNLWTGVEAILEGKS